MKLAVISDVHGNLLALQVVLDHMATQQVDVVVNLGDILSGPLQPSETADLLMERGFSTIAGNHERQLLALHDRGPQAWDPLTSDGHAVAQLSERHVQWLRSLPAHHRLAEDVLMVHGTPGSDCVYWLESVTPGLDRDGDSGLRAATHEEVAARLASGPVGAASLVLCGHTHVARAVQCGATLVVNPGSVGLQAYSDDRPLPHRVENGSPHARYATVERTAHGWTVAQHAVPYDWDAQSRVAAARGRPDWAYALATGHMARGSATIDG